MPTDKRRPRHRRQDPKPQPLEAPVPAFDFEPTAEAVAAFRVLGLSESAARGAAGAGFIEPTPVQVEVIPAVSSGRDVIGCSETGSGKTAAFALPILDLLDFESPALQVAVLVPTRELCRQVAGAFRLLGRAHGLRVVEIYGGVSYQGQRRGLREHPQVMVGTPGRVLDLLSSHDLNFRDLKILILDEADRMLDMGFMPQIRQVLKFVPKKRQTLMFSATIPAEINRLASFCLIDPVNISVGSRSRPPSQVIQEAFEISPAEKDEKLQEVVSREPGTILIFTATKSRANIIYRDLTRAGHKVCLLHSDRTQDKREQAIDEFKCGKRRIMVATDIAQRGLDIEGISLIVNYDLPNNPEDYLHRIGRTARASAPGRAVSFISFRDLPALRMIEKTVGHIFPNLVRKNKGVNTRNLKRKIR